MSRYPVLEISVASDEDDDDGDESGSEPQLPLNWQIFFDGEGRCFYHNKVTGASQYDYPIVSKFESQSYSDYSDYSPYLGESFTGDIVANIVPKFNLNIGTLDIGYTNDLSPKSISPKYQHTSQSMPSFMLDNMNNVSPNKSVTPKYQHTSQSMPSFMLDKTKSNVCDHEQVSQVRNRDIIPIHNLQINASNELKNDPLVATSLVENIITVSNPASTIYYSDMEEYSDMDDEDEVISVNATKNETNYISPRYWLQPARSNKESINKQVRLNQDYLALAREYIRLKPYTGHSHKTVCVFCAKAEANIVFFPCEHRCVCKSCVKIEKICEDRMLSSISHGHNNCPVCAQIIKLMLPHENGKVRHIYIVVCPFINLIYYFSTLGS